jgi:hypothetical protein
LANAAIAASRAHWADAVSGSYDKKTIASATTSKMATQPSVKAPRR